MSRGSGEFAHGEFLTVAERLRRNAEAFPDKPALILPRGRGGLSFAQIDRQTDALAAGLTRGGLRSGTRTIVMIPIGPDLVVTVLALFKAGGVPIVVDPGMGLRRMLHCYRMIDAEAFVGISAMHLMRRLRPRTFHHVRLAWGVAGLRELARSGDTAPTVRQGPDDLMMVGFTTGSTGLAKGVETTYGALNALVRTAEREYGHTAADTALVTSMPFLFLHLLVGATSVLPDLDFRRIARADPSIVARAAADHDVTTMFASPAVLDPLAEQLARSGRRLPALRCVVSGGAPVSTGLVDRLRSLLPDEARLYSTYGATEATPITSVESRDLLRPDQRSVTSHGGGVCVGTPSAGTRVRVVRIADTTPLTCTDLPPGQTGEIIVSGPVVSRRYLAPARANATMKILEGDTLWHRTGDVGRLDEHENLWFCGRRADLVTTEAGPLYPVCCEAVLDAHPDVYRTAVVGVGPVGRQEPAVWVQTRHPVTRQRWRRIAGELRELAGTTPQTRNVTRFVRAKSLPVDPRHNAKIDHPALARRMARR